MDCSIVLQAGGTSRRMGQDKGRMLLAGTPLIQRIAIKLSLGLPDQDGLEWILITNADPLDYAFLNEIRPFRIVGDTRPGRGALNGLYTALYESRKEYTAVVACDLPFADPAILEMGCEYLEKTREDVFIPRTPGGLEPMQAVYRRVTCLQAVKAALERGEMKAISWLGDVRTHFHNVGEVVTFFNVNTPEDFAKAEEIVRSMGEDFGLNVPFDPL